MGSEHDPPVGSSSVDNINALSDGDDESSSSSADQNNHNSGNNMEGSSSSDSDSDSDSDMSFDSSDSEHEQDKDKKVTGEAKEEEDDEEDPVIKAISKAKEKKDSNHPPDLLLDGIPSALSFHPVRDQLLFGNYEGELLLYSYSNESNEKVAGCQKKPSSVRALTFSNDGEKLISAFSDHTLIFYDVEKGLREERTIKNATNAPVSSLYAIDEHLLATGDDDGNLLIWDSRTPGNRATGSPLRLGEDAITSMISNDDRKVLVCTSEEGAIYSVKIRGGKVLVESEIYDYEFNCSCVFKHDSKLAVGDGKGDVYIFNWDEFGKHSDIYTGVGRGEAINALIPITERIILSGGDDGFIRAYHYFPQKYLGVVGKVAHPVEKLDVCNDGHLIASLGADETVKFWNVSYFEDMAIPTGPAAAAAKKEKAADGNSKASVGVGAPAGTTGKTGNKQQKGSKSSGQDLSRNNLPSSSHQNASDFFKGLAD